LHNDSLTVGIFRIRHPVQKASKKLFDQALGSDLLHVRKQINERRQAVLKTYTDQLKEHVAPFREIKPKVQLIRVSIFGFSRGGRRGARVRDLV